MATDFKGAQGVMATEFKDAQGATYVAPGEQFKWDHPGPKPLRVADFLPDDADFLEVRQRYDKALQTAGVTPVARQEGQTLKGYERSMYEALQKGCSGFFERTDFSSMSDQSFFDRYAEGIMKNAMRAPHREGVLREIRMMDPTGRKVSEYIGPKTWMNDFKAPQMALTHVCGVDLRRAG